jgi:sugar phosphate isomerase/epimerase
MLRGGAEGIEIFAARHHFDYTDRAHVREIATWFRSNPVAYNSLHQPLYSDAEWGRDVGPTVNVIDVEKARRIDAMDEIKRALEVAEMIPINKMVLHLGGRDDKWNNRALEHSLTAIEHLKAFAHPLGVRLLVENLQNEVTEPGNLLEILRVGHFDSVGVCLDVGHAHASVGVEAAFTVLKDRIRELHLHDNHGSKDEHLWPGSGTLDWPHLMQQVGELKEPPVGTLEIHHELAETPESVSSRAAAAFALLEKSAGQP